ncbi:hypothetical protein QCA50_002197 [Cerrena zonata]|uniref:C2H2-type domain-containing protein n=1 Tax=Cerrena zonata TaxID=2478898 RepID=A0AAW0GT23_9APHY
MPVPSQTQATNTPSSQPALPSVLPSSPAFQDITSTPEQINPNELVASPSQLNIYICALQDCNRLFPSRERLMTHRKNVHNSEDDSNILTWNDG